MERGDLPLSAAPDVRLREAPVVFERPTIVRTRALQPSRDDRRFAVRVHLHVGRFVPIELHAPSPKHAERRRLPHHRHSGDGDDDVVGEQRVERGGVAANVRLVPDALEPGELIDRRLRRRRHRDQK